MKRTYPFIRSSSIKSRIEQLSPFNVICLLLALAVALLIVYPLAVMFFRVLLPGGVFQVQPFLDVFGSAAFWTSVKNTALILAVSGAAALIIGSLFAWLNERTDARIPFISTILPLIPLLLPGAALGIGWVFLAHERAGYLNFAIRKVASLIGFDLGTHGPLNIASLGGLIFVYALYLVPYPYLVMSSALRNLDPALEEASRMSGAGLGRTLRMISIPSVRFAFMSSLLLLVVSGTALFSVPVILGTAARIDVLSVFAVRLVRGTFPPQLGEAVVISLFLVMVIGSVWLLNRRVQRRQRHATIGGRSGSALVMLGPWRPVARCGMVIFILATSLLPVSAIVMVSVQPFWTPRIDLSRLSFANYAQLFESQMAVRALLNSLTLGVIGATLGILIAALLAVFVRDNQGWRSSAVDGITKLPGAISNIVIGIAFLVVLSASPFYLGGGTVILLLAYLVITLPQASIAAGAAAAQVGSQLSEASWMSGVGKARTFRKITFPLMRSGLAAGWALMFVVIVGDLTVSALLAGSRNPVVGFVILDIWDVGTYSTLAALATIVTAVSFVAVGTVLFLGGGSNGGSAS